MVTAGYGPLLEETKSDAQGRWGTAESAATPWNDLCKSTGACLHSSMDTTELYYGPRTTKVKNYQSRGRYMMGSNCGPGSILSALIFLWKWTTRTLRRPCNVHTPGSEQCWDTSEPGQAACPISAYNLEMSLSIPRPPIKKKKSKLKRLLVTLPKPRWHLRHLHFPTQGQMYSFLMSWPLTECFKLGHFVHKHIHTK